MPMIFGQRNYLRVRGEYDRQSLPWVMNTELPPRARRIRVAATKRDAMLGTTSACAENTSPPATSTNACWNYLRVRGEYRDADGFEYVATELPPRARRIRVMAVTIGKTGGTTSACAENTFCPWSAMMGFGNYLRVRGEY